MKKRSLVCITSCCDRTHFIQAFAPPYIAFCTDNDSYDFLLAFDGPSEAIESWCEEWEVPLLISEQSEGVGLSKNRVLTAYPDYDYYFFFDDDVELIHERFFDEQIEVAEALQVPHFSLHRQERLYEQGPAINWGEHRILRAFFGGAPVNFFTQEAIQLIGGWHTEFAQYRRWGHTEHTYRLYHQKKVAYPFHLVETLLPCFLLHDPPSAVQLNKSHQGTFGLAKPEQALIKQQLEYFPVNTLAPFHIKRQAGAASKKVQEQLHKTKRLYPLLKNNKRSYILSLRYYTLSRKKGINMLQRLSFLIYSMVLAPGYMFWLKLSGIKKTIFNQWSE